MVNLPTHVPATSQPTFFNKNAGVGAVLGDLSGYLIAGGIFIANGGASLVYNAAVALGTNASPAAVSAMASSIAPVVGPLLMPAIVALGASSVIGAAWGAIAGKKQMERELVEGVEVKSPSFWNKNMLAGMAITDLAVTVVGLIVGLPALALLGASIAANVFGAIAGGIYGKQQMEARVVQAQLLATGNERSAVRGQGLGLDLSPDLSHQITPEENALLNAKLRESKSHKGHVAALDDTTMMAAVAGGIEGGR